jgi:hypothetical protein
LGGQIINTGGERMNNQPFITLEQIDEVASLIRGRTKYQPKIALILGSGLGSLADSIHGARSCWAVGDWSTRKPGSNGDAGAHPFL